MGAKTKLPPDAEVTVLVPVIANIPEPVALMVRAAPVTNILPPLLFKVRVLPLRSSPPVLSNCSTLPEAVLMVTSVAFNCTLPVDLSITR